MLQVLVGRVGCLAGCLDGGSCCLILGGGFKYFLFLPRTLGEDEPNLTI